MIEEKDIRAIYEGFYKIAEEVGNSKYTNGLTWQLYCMLANPRLVTQRNVEKLSKLTTTLDKEYFSKFEKLARSQGRTQK